MTDQSAEKNGSISNLENRFRALVEHNESIIALIDENFRFLFRNASASRITGWNNTELEKLPVEYLHPEDVEAVRFTLEEAVKNPEITYPIHTRWKSRSGNYIWLEGTATNKLQDPDIRGIVINLRDITRQKEAEQKLVKANRLYQFISQINQMIVKVPNEDTLFREACRIAVKIGKFRMAWIGMIDADTRRLIPVVHAGEEMDYLSKISISSVSDVPEGRDPTGTALQQGKYIFCNDIEHAPEMAPWREAALGRNYHSSISLPIQKYGKVVGAFTVYADTKHFFDAEEIALLEETTGDISYALENMQTEILRAKTAIALQESEKRYQTLAEVSPVGIFHTDPNGSTTYVNPRWCEMAGMEAEAAMGNGWLNAVHPADREVLISGWNKATKSSFFSVSEYRLVRPDGVVSWVLGQAIPERNSENVIVGYVGTLTDITGRIEAEKEIAKLYHEKRTVLNRINDGMVSVDNEWRYTFLNDAALATHPFGKEETIGKVIWEVHPEMKGTIFWDKYHEAMATGKMVEFENYYPPMNTWFSVKVYPSHDGLTILYSDITEKRMAEKEIEKEKSLSDSIINSLPGIFYLYTEEGKFLRWNKNFEIVSLYTGEEIQQMHPLDFFDQSQQSLVEEKIHNTFTLGNDSVQADFLLKTKEKIPYYFTGTSIEYEGVVCLLGVGVDFSERVKAQEQIKETTEQLRLLTAHLQKVREEERKRIGREIHDELGQQLTAIKMDIAWMDKKLPEDTIGIKRKLTNVITLLDAGNKSIRRILSELRPGIFDDRGLVEALEWLGKQLSENAGIAVEFTSSEDALVLPETISTCIFRVYQEALTNILRYAQAKKVSASLKLHEGFVVLTIEDNGIGFDPASVQITKSFGILGMKERVLSLKGKFELTSLPGNGTYICIRIPLDVQKDV